MDTRRTPGWAFVATAVALGLTALYGGGAGSPRVGIEAGLAGVAPLSPAETRETGRVLVRFRADASEAHRRDVVGRAGGEQVTANGRLRVSVLRARDPRTAIAALRGDPAVEWAEPEIVLQRFADAATPERAELAYAEAHAADSRLRGAGVRVAVIDDGVYADNPDLTGRVEDGGDYSGDVPVPVGGTTPAGSHGTAVATVLAAAADGRGMVGAVPEARVVAFRVFSRTGGGSSYSVANAIVAAADAGVDVANLSLGSPYDSRVLRDAIAVARRVAPRMVLVAAAGNDGAERPNYPAASPYVVSVGATERTSVGWTVTDFSNKGDVDVVAPGRSVLAWYTSGNGAPAAPVAVDGTSFAAPEVAGIVAQLAGVGVTGDRARAAVVASAETTIASAYPAVASGRGRADALKAFRLATGGSAYGAVFVGGGMQVANVVGRRRVEALRFDPKPGTAPDGPPVIKADRGTVTSAQAAAPVTDGVGVLHRVDASYSAPTTSAGVVDARLTAAAAGEAAAFAPLRLVDPNVGPEGAQAVANTRVAPVLRFGERTRYVVSVGMAAGAQVTVEFSYPSTAPASATYVWAPSSSGGVASAADPPVAGDDGSAASGTLTYTAPRAGRYVIGFVLESASDNGTYALTLRYAVPSATLSAPGLSTQVSSSTGFAVSWGSPSSSAASYDVERAVPLKSSTGWKLGAWQPWQSATAARSAVFSGAAGTTYYFRARARDAQGNPGPWTAMASTSVPADDRQPSFRFSTGWLADAPGGRFKTTRRVGTRAGQSLSFTTETSRLMLIGDRCSTCGQIRVYVDNVLKATIDTRAASTAARVVLYDSGKLGTIRSHTLRVDVVGTAGRPRVALDAIALIR